MDDKALGIEPGADMVQQLLSRGDLLGVVLALLLIGGAFAFRYYQFGGKSKPSNKGDTIDLSERVTNLSERVTQVEHDLKHVPTRDEFHALSLQIAKLEARSGVIEQITERTGRIVGRIEDFMLSLARTK